MRKLHFAFVLLAVFIFSAFIAFAEENSPKEQCAIEDTIVAKMLGKPLSEGPLSYLGGIGKVEFRVSIARGNAPCEFIYSYRMTNVGNADVFAYWKLPPAAPNLFFLPTGESRKFSFRWSGQPMYGYAKTRLFVKMWDKSEPYPKIETNDDKEHFWDMVTGAETGIFLPKKWNH